MTYKQIASKIELRARQSVLKVFGRIKTAGSKLMEVFIVDFMNRNKIKMDQRPNFDINAYSTNDSQHGLL